MILGVLSTALLVRDYDEAKNFYCEKLGFTLLEDKNMGEGKRWVRIKAPGGMGSEFLLAKAVGDQLPFVGNQGGGRVMFFLHTNNFDADYAQMVARGVEFMEKPRSEVYGKVVVFKDLYGNLYDLIQPAGLTD